MELSKSHGSHQGAAHQADDEVCEIGDADANSIRGEALFLRAPFHFEAWKMWRNIPYYTEEDADFRKPNTGANAIPLILADLDAAIGLLPDASRNGQVGRVSSWTAKACKGRVQVYSSDYAGALTTLRDVRDSGPHALEDGFHQDWTGLKDFANGPEAILVYQASVNNGNPNGDNGNWGERLNFPHGEARSAAADSTSRPRTWSTSSASTPTGSRSR